MESTDLYRTLYTMNPSMVKEQRDAIRKLKQRVQELDIIVQELNKEKTENVHKVV